MRISGDVAILLSRASEMRQQARQDAGWCWLSQGYWKATISEPLVEERTRARRASMSVQSLTVYHSPKIGSLYAAQQGW
jgi:hypothetical protein